jgi:3'-phosphoadenosine 5'-phosphosulfate sulfotransferase (PAPS reductase)/FAD synthetase
MNFGEIFDRHEKIALQFSGGKDSLVVLHMLREYWGRLTVYYCDSGNSFPETRELIDVVRSLVPNFVIIRGIQPEIVSKFGFPSDIVPFNSTVFGRNQAGDTGFPMIDRYTCCSSSIMVPLHAKMVDDGVTLIIRGQRNDDAQKSPMRSGMSLEGFEVLFPIQDWTEEQVFDYLKANSIPIPRFYTSGTSSAHDCMNCTAWLEHGQAGYLKQYYPEEYKTQQERYKMMLKSASPVLARLNSVIEQEDHNGW